MNPRRWQILAVVLVVLLMTPLDSSAVNVILWNIRDTFHIPQNQVGLMSWVALSYLVIIGGLILPLGRLGDLFGFRRLFLSGVVIFTAASAICGLAPGLGWLVGARVLQGIGAAVLMALGPGIITALFPPQERGRALGLLGMGIALGLVLGPTLAGLLTGLWSWRLVFYINLPIGLIGGFLSWRNLPPLGGHAHPRIDWAGSLLGILTLSALLAALTQSAEWPLRVLLPLIGFSLAAGIAFVVVEHRHPMPMIDFRLFHNRVFLGANIATMLNFLGQFSALFLTPLLLKEGFGLPTSRIGLFMGVTPLAVLVLAPISGALSDRLGTRALAAIGEAIVALGLLGMALILPLRQPDLILPMLVLVGIGTGLFQSPNNSAIMGSVPRTHLGIGGGVLATMRNVGMSLGIAVSSMVVAVAVQHVRQVHGIAEVDALFHGVRLAFFTGAAFVAVGSLTSVARDDRKPQSAGESQIG